MSDLRVSKWGFDDDVGHQHTGIIGSDDCQCPVTE